MKNNLSDLLDKIYEIEGLVQLKISREDAPERILTLIKEKSDALALAASAIMPGAHAASSTNVDTSASLEGEGIGEYVVSDETDCRDINPRKAVDKGTNKKKADEQQPNGRIVFTLNDRYRFKRALFDNDEAEFNNTLSIVASMENYDEAESFFIDEYQWDSDMPEVKEFMTILKKYFKE